jgi:cyclopropane-fatty-acyl-phospholipid synthase
MANLPLALAERRQLPSSIIRAGIRRLLRQRLRESVPADCEQRAHLEHRFVEAMDAAPLALNTVDANVQHYEVPSAFFELVMGRHLKYSCCLYEEGTLALTDAETAMLERTATRAQLFDGQQVLELGCGWGSLSLWMAEHYPASRITAVSNSRGQKAYIDAQSQRRGLQNLEVVTADMNDFDTPARFDRVVSVEMFEHMRNWRELFRRIHGWLVPGGKLFFHVFCHRTSSYEFSDSGGDDDWMARHFFTGGMMPAASLPLRFQQHLSFERYHAVNGMHYARTCEDWLDNLDRNAARAREILAEGRPMDGADVQLQRWRLFFMSCAELFAFDGGNEWHVGHYRFVRDRQPPR